MPTFNAKAGLGGLSRRLFGRSSPDRADDHILGSDRLIINDQPSQAGDSDLIKKQDQELVYSLAPSRIPNTKQLKYLSTILTSRDRQFLQWWMTLAAMAALTLGISFFNRHIVFLPAAGGTLTEGVVGSPQSVNPLLARPNTVDQDLVGLTFRGLTRIDAQGNAVPDLAKTIATSADGKTYTVTLPNDARWSDDESITTADVKYTIDTILDPTYKSRWRTQFTGVTTQIVNDQTLTLTIPEARPLFLQHLSVGLLPEHLWSDTTPEGFALAELNVKPVGNGPYQFRSLTKDRDGNILGYQLVRHKNLRSQPPYIEKFQIKFYSDQTTALDALKNNSIDVLGGVNVADDQSQLKNRQLKAFPLTQLTAVFFNQRKNPAIKAKEVRQALALASDRQGIIDKILHGQGKLLNGPILPDSIGYNPDVKRYDFKPDEANALLEQTGWKKNDRGIRQKGSQLLTFTFSTVNDPTYVQVANQLVKNWQSIGAQVELKTYDSRRIQKDVIRPRAYESLLFGEIYDIDTDPYQFWDSSQLRESGFNLAVYFNKHVDQDLAQARASTSRDVKEAKYLDFQNIIAEDIPAIFLYQPHYVYAHPKNLHGLPNERLTNGHDRFRTVSQWYVKTKIGWTNKKK